MSTEPPAPARYSSAQTVYRAARNKSCVQEEEVMEVAFYRRTVGDSKGLSVATTPEDAKKGLKKCHGTISIGVGEVRKVYDKGGVALDVVPDPSIENKGNIVDPPCFDDPDREKRQEGIRLARVLARLAKLLP